MAILHRKQWKHAARDAVLSGAVASVVSSLALARRGQVENDAPLGPTNAISHWVWGDEAARHDEASVRHTLLGYLIHHASATFWAAFYERFFGRAARRNPAQALLGGAAVAATACFVDYKLTPHRLQPGYEMRLSRRSLFLVYGAFALGLAASDLARQAARRRR